MWTQVAFELAVYNGMQLTAPRAAADAGTVKRAKVICKTKRYCSGSHRIVTLALPQGHWDGVAVPGDPAAGRTP